VPPPVAPPIFCGLKNYFFISTLCWPVVLLRRFPHMEQYAEPHGVTLPAWPCKHYGLACCSGRIRIM
jgi:hypothetical protein